MSSSHILRVLIISLPLARLQTCQLQGRCPTQPRAEERAPSVLHAVCAQPRWVCAPGRMSCVAARLRRGPGLPRTYARTLWRLAPAHTHTHTCCVLSYGRRPPAGARRACSLQGGDEWSIRAPLWCPTQGAISLLALHHSGKRNAPFSGSLLGVHPLSHGRVRTGSIDMYMSTSYTIVDHDIMHDQLTSERSGLERSRSDRYRLGSDLRIRDAYARVRTYVYARVHNNQASKDALQIGYGGPYVGVGGRLFLSLCICARARARWPWHDASL